MSHIFISYSRKDSVCVLKVARQLEARGYSVWIDADSLAGGEDWAIKIVEGISGALLTLLFWSKNAAASPYVEQEYTQALQRQMQSPEDKRRIIPVLLDPIEEIQLPDILSGKQGIKLFQCARNEIDALVREVNRDARLKQRRFSEFDSSVSAGDQTGSKPLTMMDNLVSVPFMQSVHCNAEIITAPDMRLVDILTLPDEQRRIQVFLRFMFAVNDEQAIKRIYQTIERENANNERTSKQQKPIPFFMLHITGPSDGTNYTLGDSPDGFWQGEWLDAVNSTVEAITRLIGQDGATIQLFNAIPASLNFAIGMQLFKYWQFQLYHYTRDQRYQLVMQTTEL